MIHRETSSTEGSVRRYWLAAPLTSAIIIIIVIIIFIVIIIIIIRMIINDDDHAHHQDCSGGTDCGGTFGKKQLLVSSTHRSHCNNFSQTSYFQSEENQSILGGSDRRPSVQLDCMVFQLIDDADYLQLVCCLRKYIKFSFCWKTFSFSFHLSPMVLFHFRLKTGRKAALSLKTFPVDDDGWWWRWWWW